MNVDRNSFRLISAHADKAVRPAARRLRLALNQQVKTIANELEQGKEIGDILHREGPGFQKVLDQIKGSWGLVYAVDGYNVGGALVGKSGYLVDYQAKTQETLVADTEFWGADEIVASHVKPRVSRWVQATSKLETKASADRYQRIIRRAMKGWTDPETGDWRAITRHELAVYFEAEGLAASDTRAELMARTLTHWSYNEGAVSVYEAAGANLGEWLTVMDNVTGEWDAAMNGMILPLRENYVTAGDVFQKEDGSLITAAFDIEHPPLHPNCRCTIIPVI